MMMERVPMLAEGYEKLTADLQLLRQERPRIVDAIEEARLVVPSGQWVEVFFKDFVLYPEETAQCLLDRLEVERTPAVEMKLREVLAAPVNAISAPAWEKWRTQNPTELTELLPRIADRCRTLGCTVDANSGMFEYESIAPSFGKKRELAIEVR